MSKLTSTDYRIPQILYQFGCLMYSPPLESHIRNLKPIPSDSNWEIELRGVSIWCVELIKREIERRHPEAKFMKHQPQQQQQPSPPATIPESPSFPPDHESEPLRKASTDTNAIMDERKCTTQKHSKQKSIPEPHGSGVNAILIDFFLYDTMKTYEADGRETIPHHRTRSIWY